MPTFDYQAQSQTGEMVRGIVFGTSLDNAARELASKGMQVHHIGLAVNHADPLSVNVRPMAPAASVPAVAPVNGAPAYSPAETIAEFGTTVVAPPTDERSYAQTSVWGPLVGQVPLTNLAFFFRQLGTMLRAGVPIVQALDTLSSQARHAKLSAVITEIKGHVEAGRSMSVGMQRYPEVFTPITLSLSRAGEEGGFLDSSMTQIANYLEREIELRNLYKRLTFMPKLQVVASMIVIVGANMIIDSIKPEARHLSSPLTTKETWYWLTPIIVAIFLFLRLGLANPRIKYNWDLVVSNLPGFGKMVRELATARFGRAFGALYKGGVPLQRAMQMAADACGNEYLRSRIYPAARKMEGGTGIAETFRSTGAFSSIVLDMVSTGERTGNLEEMLERLSEFYEDEAKVKSTKVATLVGVLVGLGVAIYIGYIVITFWQGYGNDTGAQINQASG